MGHLLLLWRLLRFATFELPVCLLIATLIWTVIDNLTLTTDRLSVLLAAGGLALACICWFAWCLAGRPSDTHGSASFANSADIARAGLRSQGAIIGKKGGRLLRFNRPGHLLTFAPTRSGRASASSSRTCWTIRAQWL